MNQLIRARIVRFSDNLGTRTAAAINAIRDRYPEELEEYFDLEELCPTLSCGYDDDSYALPKLCIPNEWLCDGYNDCLVSDGEMTAWDETEDKCDVKDRANFSQVIASIETRACNLWDARSLSGV